jgi:initiation factor 1A
MPKNKGKGGKNRRRGKGGDAEEKRELIFKEDGQEYAQVLRMLGNGRLEAQCIDGVKRLCHIRGKMRKKVWVNQGDIVLIGLREFQDGKGDVILKVSERGALEHAVFRGGFFIAPLLSHGPRMLTHPQTTHITTTKNHH